MQDNKEHIREYIISLNREFQEIHGGSFVKLDTGEIFTKTETEKYIQRKIEEYVSKFLEQTKEISKEINDIEPEQRLINNRSKKKKNKTQYLRENYDGGNFNIVYKEKLKEVMELKLDNNEKLVFYVIRDFVQYPTNCVVINDHIPSMSELEPIIGLNERTIRKALKGLEEKRLIKLKQSGHRKAIYINPEYYASGKELEVETLQMFGSPDYDEDKIDFYMN